MFPSPSEKPIGLPSRLIRLGIGSVAVKVVAVALSLAMTIVLARVLGPSGYGVYSFVFALIALLSAPAQLGFPPLLVRETARAQVENAWGRMRALWRWTTTMSILSSLLIIVIVSASVFTVSTRLGPTLSSTLLAGAIVIPFLALANARSAALRGLRHVLIGQIPDSVLRPALLIVLVGVLAVLSPQPVRPEAAMSLHATACAIAFLFAHLVLQRIAPVQVKVKPPLEYDLHSWIRASIPLALIEGFQLINSNTDIVILGLFRTSDEVGIYRVASSGCLAVGFGLAAVKLVVAPYIARIYRQQDHRRLKQLVAWSSWGALLFAIPIFATFLLFGETILRVLVGNDFVSAATPLAILSAGQLINAAFGCVGVLLSMTGHERDTLRGFSWSVLANIILNFILVPTYGSVGAACATMISVITWNLVLAHFAYRRLNIITLPMIATRSNPAEHSGK